MQGRAPVWNPGAELKDGRLVPVFFDWSPQPPQIVRERQLQLDALEATRRGTRRSEEHTSELQSLMRISYAVFCLKKKKEQISNMKPQTYPNITMTTNHMMIKKSNSTQH